MAKRDIVKVNFEKLICLVENTEWTQAAFARLVGKHNRWLSSVAKGKNLPSPEEAAKMCLLLQTTPEEILLHSDETEEKTQKCLEDIEEVKRLIEEERGRNVEKAPADKSGSQSEEEFTRLFQQLSPEEQANEIAYLRERIAREAAKGK